MPKMSLHGKLISSCAGFRLRTNSLRALEDVPYNKAVAKVPSAASASAAAETASTIPSLHNQTIVAVDPSSICINSSSEVFGRPEFRGICVPVDISMIFQVNEGEDLRSQVTDSDTEVDSFPRTKNRASKLSRLNSLSPEDPFANFEHHNRDSCLGCYRICSKAANENDDQGELSDVFCAGGLSTDVLTVRGPSLKRDSSSRKCSFSGDVPAGSVTSQTSAESVPIDKELLSENTSVGKSMIRKEVLRLVINLGSSVGVKGTEQALLIMKQKFPAAFQDLCLYSEVCLLLNNCSYRLVSRRFVQELFQDLNFDECTEDPQHILGIPEDNVIKFSEQFETDHHLHQVLEY
jgi:hypothetical protein